MTTEKPYYPALEAKIAENGIAKKDIAAMLGITPRSLTSKLSGETDLWLKEAIGIWNLFPDIPVDVLFRHEESDLPGEDAENEV